MAATRPLLRAALLALAAACALAAPAAAATRPGVIGGTQPAADALPWIASILIHEGPTTYVCTGSLIAPRWVITAAHCMTTGAGTQVEPWAVRVGLGNQRIGARLDWVTVDRVVRDPFFSRANLHRDDALVHLAADPPGPPAPVRLATPDESSLYAGDAQVAGWGATTDSGDASDTLHEATVPILADQACLDAWSGLFDPVGTTCAGIADPVTGPATCHGDSGGPLFVEVADAPVVLGLTSYGGASCLALPTVFQRTSVLGSWVAEVEATPIVDPPILSGVAVSADGETRIGAVADVDPRGASTRVWLETAGGARLSPVRTVAAGAPAHVALVAAGLRAFGRYAVRVVARNAAGTAPGALARLRLPDATAPSLVVRPARGRAGAPVALRLVLGDASGTVRAAVTVRLGRRVVAQATTGPVRAAPPRGIRLSVRVGAPGRASWCAVAVDPAGNRSPRRCAALVLA